MTPLEMLKHHVTGAIERGEGVAIREVTAEAVKTYKAALTERDAVRRLAHTEYQKVCDVAYSKYQKAHITADTEYLKVCDTAAAEYCKAIGTALTQSNNHE